MLYTFYTTHLIMQILKFIVSVCFLLTCTVTTHAAIIVVNDPTDNGQIDGLCDLRDALYSASINISVDACTAGQSGVQDIVIIQVPGPIQLNSTIAVFGAVTVATNIGAPAVEIKAANERRHFRVSPNSFEDSNFSMANLILSGGNATSDNGGAISFVSVNSRFERIELTDMVFLNNHATIGGALSLDNVNANHVSIINSEFINNTAASFAGAIYGERLVLPGSSATSLTLNNNLFLNNHSSNNVGAVYIGNQGGNEFNTEMIGNVYIGNTATEDIGALHINGIITPWNISISNNLWLFNQSSDQAGAIFVSSAVISTLSNSVIAFNQARIGGGILARFDDALINLYHSTVIHNSATSSGDNIYVYGDARITSQSNVIAYPRHGDNCSGLLGTNLSSSRNNLVDDMSCEMLSSTSLLSIADPHLSGFSSSDDYFPGFQPTAASPALDNSECSLLVDAIGNSRPNDGDGNGLAFCDMGGLEAPSNTDLIWSDAFGL